MDFDSVEWFCLFPAYSLGRMIIKLSTIGYKFALVELRFLHMLLSYGKRLMRVWTLLSGFAQF